MFGAAIAGKLDAWKDIVNALSGERPVLLIVIVIIVKMEKMKIFTMKLRDKMKNQRPKEDNE